MRARQTHYAIVYRRLYGLQFFPANPQRPELRVQFGSTRGSWSGELAATNPYTYTESPGYTQTSANTGHRIAKLSSLDAERLIIRGRASTRRADPPFPDF